MKDYLNAFIPLLFLAILFAGILAAACADKDERNRQLVQFKSSQGYTWCGQRRFITYKGGLVTIRGPKDQDNIFYSDFSIVPVESCSESEQK